MRTLLLLLALLLPLQFGWAAVAEPCEGAHVMHAHDEGDEEAVGEMDCSHHCHGAMTPLPSPTIRFQLQAPADVHSAVCDTGRPAPPAPRPERPQWPPLA